MKCDLLQSRAQSAFNSAPSGERCPCHTVEWRSRSNVHSHPSLPGKPSAKATKLRVRRWQPHDAGPSKIGRCNPLSVYILQQVRPSTTTFLDRVVEPCCVPRCY